MRTSVKADEINAVIQQYSPGILRLAYAYCKTTADAEDIAQDVLIAYFQKAPVFHDERQRKAWILCVTANKCKDFLKSSWKKSVISLPDDLGYLPEEESGLLSCVLSLDEKYRIPIHLFYYEGYSIAEIARITHCSEGTAGSRLARARKLLKDQIGDELYE
jgi:RNA polymerase sigma-70 factor (ECF subfamily)